MALGEDKCAELCAKYLKPGWMGLPSYDALSAYLESFLLEKRIFPDDVTDVEGFLSTLICGKKDFEIWEYVKLYLCSRLTLTAEYAMRHGLSADAASKWLHETWWPLYWYSSYYSSNGSINVGVLLRELRKHVLRLSSYLPEGQPNIESYEQLPEKIQEAIIYIRTNLYRRKLSVKTVAEEVGLSASYFSVLFSKHMKMAPGEYISDLRLTYARELLRMEKLDVTEAAEAVGMERAQFSKAYHAKFGHMPSEDKRIHGFPSNRAL